MTSPSPNSPVDKLPWREILQWSAMGVLMMLAVVAVDVSRNGGNNPVSLIQPGTLGPATAAITADFPQIEQPTDSGLDGQQYYAIARDPLHLNETAEHLDNPRYRLQRPLLPWLAWTMQPTGGGLGLVYALFLVGLGGIFVGAVASGAMSTMWRGPPWIAALFPLLPGVYWSLRVTVSDSLAVGLALAAIVLAARQRSALAVAAGVLAVLAKEPAILILLGWGLHRRTKRDAALVAIPAVVIAAWMGWLALVLPTDPDRAQDLGLPFVGLVEAVTTVWSNGQQLVGMAAMLGGLAVGAGVLALRRFRHPLGWAIAVQLVFLSILGVNPASVNFGATRMALPIMILSAIALATPHAGEPAVTTTSFASAQTSS